MKIHYVAHVHIFAAVFAVDVFNTLKGLKLNWIWLVNLYLPDRVSLSLKSLPKTSMHKSVK